MVLRLWGIGALISLTAAAAPAPSPPPGEAAPPAPSPLVPRPEPPDPVDPSGPRSGEAVVTASRVPVPLSSEGRAVSVATSEELSRRAPRTTPDALSEEEGMFLQRTGAAGGAPVLRGLVGQHVLLLVDGVRINNATVRAGPSPSLNTVDPFWVEQIEVVRGPGSVLYGSDAVGGVVNVLTVRPRFSSRLRASSLLRLIAGSADLSLQTHLRQSISTPSTAATAALTGRLFHDVAGGALAGVQRYTGYREMDGALKVRQRLWPSALLELQYQAIRQMDAPRTDLSRPGDFRLVSRQERDLVHGGLSVSGLGPFSRGTVDLSLHRQAEQSDRFQVAQDRIDRDDVTDWTLGARAEAEARPSLGWLELSPLILGAELYGDVVESQGFRGAVSTWQPSLRPELSRYATPTGALSGAAYAFAATDVQKPLAVRGGVRAQLNQVDLPADDRLSRLFAAAAAPPPAFEASRERSVGLAAELGAQLRLPGGALLLANAGTSFRSPNVDDFLRLGAEGPGFSVPSRGLRTEQSYTGEIGLRAGDGPASASALYAFTLVDGLIANVPTVVAGETATPDGARYLQRVNADSAYIHAVEAQGALELAPRWTLTAHLTWSHGTQLRRDPRSTDPAASIEEPLPRSPPLNGAVRLSYLREDGAFAELTARWAAPQTRLSETDRGDLRICPESPSCDGTPGFVAVHARGGVRLGEAFRVGLTVQNLTNQTYRLHGSGVDEPGLSAVLDLEAKL
jgi:iron complex outermembrane receptor protein/hemoglobin/transferrin/lactoferrin receptor protein